MKSLDCPSEKPCLYVYSFDFIFFGYCIFELENAGFKFRRYQEIVSYDNNGRL